MAEFGVSATQLTEPQGSGARVVEPVRAMDIGTNPLFQAASNVADIFAKGIQADRKSQADALKNAVVKQYYDEVNKITAGVEQGSVRPAQASVRSRTLLAQMLAQNPGLTTELTEAAKTLNTFSSLGSIEKQVAEEADLMKRQLSDAEKSGIYLSASAGDSEKQAAIASHAADVRADAAFKRMAERNRFVSDMNKEQREAFQFQDREDSFQMVNEVARAKMDYFYEFGEGLRKDVTSGKKTLEEARSSITKSAADIRGALLAASRTNPQFASAYSKVFEDVLGAQLQLLDPKNRAEDYENKLKEMKNRLIYMTAIREPEFLTAISMASALPGAPTLQIKVGNEALKAWSLMSTTSPSEAAPNVIGAGNPKVEKEVVDAFKANLQGLGKNTEEKKAVAEMQASNVAGHVLTQAGTAVSNGKLSTESMLGVVQGIADPAFYKLRSEGKLTNEALNSGVVVLQTLFDRTEKDAMTRLSAPLRLPIGPVGSVPRAPRWGGVDAREVMPQSDKAVKDVVEFKAGPGGVILSLKEEGRTPAEKSYYQGVLKDLGGVEKVVNTALRAAAHISGSNDYQKYWDENKHEMLPLLFKAPEKKAEKAPKYGTEGEMRDGIAELMKLKINMEETKNVLRDALKRTDLSPEARKQIEKDLEMQ